MLHTSSFSLLVPAETFLIALATLTPRVRYYLKTGQYPNDADRAQKSRLRSAAMHYRLVSSAESDTDKLMLKDKEVISDPALQSSIARDVHVAQHHAGINKTTATIAETYHWTRIKETASLTIRNCPKCRESSKAPVIRPDEALFSNGNSAQGYTSVSALGRDLRGDHDQKSVEADHTSDDYSTRQQLQYQHASKQENLSQQQQDRSSSVPLDPQLVQRLQSATDEPHATTANMEQPPASMSTTEDPRMSDAQDEWMSYISGKRAVAQSEQEHDRFSSQQDAQVLHDGYRDHAMEGP